MKPYASTHRGWHGRGYLPHCDFPGLIQSVSVHLFDSVPIEVIERWVRELDSACDKKSREKLCSRIERYADMGYGCRERAGTPALRKTGPLHSKGIRVEKVWALKAGAS